MRVYGLTDVGKRIASSKEGANDELKVLQFLKENRTGMEDELEVVGGDRYIMKKLVRENLVRELTT